MRHLPYIFTALALAVAISLAAYWSREQATSRVLDVPEPGKDLVIVVRPGPIDYLPGPDGSAVGIDADLLRMFAAEKGLQPRFLAADSPTEIFAMLAKGEAHIGAGGLLRPLPAKAPIATSKAAAAPRTAAAAGAAESAGSAEAPAAPPGFLWTAGLRSIEPVLIYNSEGFKPANWDDLEGETVSYVEGLGLEPEIGAARTLHPEVRWEAVNVPPASLISQISDGTLSYAIVSSAGAAVARNIYLNFEVAFPIGGKRDVAWVVAERFPVLRDDLDRFLARVKRDGTLARLTERYVQNDTGFRRIDAGALIDRAPTLLPRLRPIFHDAQVKTGIEWRLLAAIAFQESQWDQGAQSETGVRGIMQITEDTARRLGINDLLDPAQNILGAARYLRDIKAKLPERIREPDRTWLALAAYNIGIGHLEDARILAQKQKLNPDLWSDVKKVLPLLASPEYYEQSKLGYARGGMPVAFVDRVRGYYDVLLAQEQPHRPRLTLSVGSADTAPALAAPAAK